MFVEPLWGWSLGHFFVTKFFLKARKLLQIGFKLKEIRSLGSSNQLPPQNCFKLNQQTHFHFPARTRATNLSTFIFFKGNLNYKEFSLIRFLSVWYSFDRRLCTWAGYFDRRKKHNFWVTSLNCDPCDTWSEQNIVKMYIVCVFPKNTEWMCITTSWTGLQTRKLWTSVFEQQQNIHIFTKEFVIFIKNIMFDGLVIDYLVWMC